MSLQPEVAGEENDNVTGIQGSQVLNESISSGQVSLLGLNRHQDSTNDHVGEGSSNPVKPGLGWQQPGRSLEHRAAAANKYGRKPSYTGGPVPLPLHYLQFNTEQYTKFDRNEPYNVPPAPTITGGSYYVYDQYHLCTDLYINRAEDVPQLPIRLDDRLCALVYEHFQESQLSLLWPSEFDSSGMVKATRAPLGYAAKHYYKAGDTDYDGNTLQLGDEGWYYLWLGGLHCLMGKEGFDAGRYLRRPAGERRIRGFAFKKLYKAEIQAAPGWLTDDLPGR